MEPGLPQKLQIKEYVRLLQFDTKQVEAFLNNYGIDYRLDEIAKEFGLEEQEIKKPLFCWMFSMIYSKSKDHIQYLKNRSLLYHEFIHSVIRGKHIEEAKEYDFKKYYIKEKKIMRKIAALKQIYLDDLTKKILIERIKEFGLEINDDDNGILNPILNSYFYSKIADSSEEETIDFVHDSFREYLLAEYYIESILDNKIFRLNARLPTMETINFLDGIINLLLEKKDSKIYNLVSEKSDGLLRSFDYNKKQDNAIKDLFELTFECIEKENIVFFNNNKKDTLKEENKTESIWVSPSISYDDYRILLVHKWIALYIYNNLNISKDISNFKGIEKVIFLTSKFMPVYLKNLKYIDLSELNLTEADLSGADLRGSVLTKAKLIEADLTGANLSGADLTETEMIDAIITEADLTGADLTSADLTRIEITGTDLRNVRNLTISKEDAKQSGAIV